VPDLPEPVEGAPLAGSTPVPAAGEARSATRIEVVTDKLVAQIDPIGGTLVGLRLREYPVSVDQPDVPYVLLTEAVSGYHVAQTGLVDTDGRAPNHTEPLRVRTDGL
jgi:YidC/Oxa1 family membrane protein insertase